MAETFSSRFKKAWSIIKNKDPTIVEWDNGQGYYYRPDRVIPRYSTDRSFITSVYGRIAQDVAAKRIEHVQLDENGRYLDTIESTLNYCLTTEANIDQTGRAMILDAAFSMLEEGSVAIVPTRASENIRTASAFKVGCLRVAKITQWYPYKVKVELYDEDRGQKFETILPKSSVAIIENPFYTVMNAPNSTLQRLIRKLSILDAIDEHSGSGKLDLIIQLPYSTKSQLKQQQAAERRKQIDEQLAGSKYGIAYIDTTERITQLNRPVENNIMSQVEYLTSMLYSQLGITQSILDGTADEKAMLNYENRIVEPILSAIVSELSRKFLTKTARTQGQSIMFFSDPFKLVPINNIAEIADKFTRNEILTPNEIRQVIGMTPSGDPESDKLRNRNINQKTDDSENQNEGGEDIDPADV